MENLAKVMKKPPKGGLVLAGGLAMIGGASYYYYLRNEEAKAEIKIQREAEFLKKNDDLLKDLNDSAKRVKKELGILDKEEDVKGESSYDRFKYLDGMKDRRD